MVPAPWWTISLGLGQRLCKTTATNSDSCKSESEDCHSSPFSWFWNCLWVWLWVVDAIVDGEAPATKCSDILASLVVDIQLPCSSNRHAIKYIEICQAIEGFGMVRARRNSVCTWVVANQRVDGNVIDVVVTTEVTGTAEVRENLLSDGSRLWLNALSAVDVRFDSHQRLLELRLGEVLVDTARDTLRPFLLDTPQGRLRALGTRFGVRESHGQTLLSVFAGAVEVRLANDQVQVANAGQQLSFAQNTFGPLQPVSPAREAWRRGVLLADNLPLGQLLEELARHRHGHLGCDPAVAQMPVMGSFPLKDTDQALRLLAAALPISVEKPLPWWVNVGGKSGS